MSKALKLFALITLLALLGFLAWWGIATFRHNHTPELKTATVMRRNLVVAIQASGVVEPANKVTISPPIAGRIDKLYVDEGDRVSAGQVIAEMSSSSRAALLDIAQSKNQDERNTLSAAYQATKIFAPVAGTIISKQVVSGQTVGLQNTLYELSDYLLVRAQVDETDLAAIHPKMATDIAVEAFPDKVFRASVRRIALEAKPIDNVTVYPVEIIFKGSPEPLLSGMTANVNFIVEKRGEILTLPVWAVSDDGSHSATVTTIDNKSVKITLGLSDGRSIEVSGLEEGTKIIVQALALGDEGKSSPFSSPHKGKSPTGAGSGGR